jgi:hypothetical protein
VKKGMNMSEAKPQDGSAVKGYRTLSHGEIGKMNQFKDLSRQFVSMLQQHGNDVSNEPFEQSADHHEAFQWMMEAHKAMQKACMYACRSVARPDADC